ncbi:MAG: type II and III secretion system protein [Verrucomicrobiae bacterium]|nr:type II and III secretion system protein [Verrucomicrobiae bacterium]
MNKPISFCIMVLLFWGSSSTLIAQNGNVVSLYVGQNPARLEMPYDIGTCKLAEGGDAIVSIRVEGRTIGLSPLQMGRTMLEVRDAAGALREELTVLISERYLNIDDVKALLVDGNNKPLPTLEAELLPGGDRAKITGNIVLPRDLRSIQKVKEAFGERVIDLTEIHSAYFAEQANIIQTKIRNPNISVRHVGDQLFLTGMAYTKQEKLEIEALARAVFPQVESFITFRPGQQYEDFILEKPLIQIECQIMEITQKAAKGIGIDWGGLLPVTVSAQYRAETGVAPSGFISLDTSKLINSIIPQVQDGNAKTLYSQTLVCETGEKAKFFAGGTFWIVAYLEGSEDISTEEVEYGISLELEPAADKHGNVQSVINIEFSNLGETINNYPSLHKRYLKTSINVKRGQTLSLGGLMGTESQNAIKKIPALGSIPVLGNLFGSKNFQQGNSEMVIFVTPRVVISGGEDNDKLRERLENQLVVPTNTDLRKEISE